MALDDIERLHYYERQFLGARDFIDEQSYLRDMRRRHNLGLHTWGIVVGLELVQQLKEGTTDEYDVYLLPGLAIDGYGREIVVLDPSPLDPAAFASFAASTPQELPIWIAYIEEATGGPKQGYQQCDIPDQFARTRERYQIVVLPPQPTHGDVIVAGKPETAPTTGQVYPSSDLNNLTIPPDESVPYQQLPDQVALSEWLVPIGWVHWEGKRQTFVHIAPERLILDRRYAGTVTSEILAPLKTVDFDEKTSAVTVNSQLRLRPRMTPSDADATDFASIEGRLRVDGAITAKKNIYLDGGQLSFRDTGGQEDNAPLWMQRQGGPAGIGSDLRIHIGPPGDAKTRLTIGPGTPDGTNEQVVLAIKSDQTVDIPTGSLNFGTLARQMINLWTTMDGKHQYGIGVQTNTTYFRSHAEFSWFRDGDHQDDQSNPGAGGALQLRLDAQGNLNFGAREGQMLNLFNTNISNYGIGIQDNTLYFRSDDDFCWFEGGTHVSQRSNSGGGTLNMKLDDNGNLWVRGNITSTSGFIGSGGTPITSNGALDVAVGEFEPQPHPHWVDPLGSQPSKGTFVITVTSRLQKVQTAFMTVALSEIFNRDAATNARWMVAVRQPPTRRSDNSFDFTVEWEIDDDGIIFRVSYVAIFIAP